MALGYADSDLTRLGRLKFIFLAAGALGFPFKKRQELSSAIGVQDLKLAIRLFAPFDAEVINQFAFFQREGDVFADMNAGGEAGPAGCGIVGIKTSRWQVVSIRHPQFGVKAYVCGRGSNHDIKISSAIR